MTDIVPVEPTEMAPKTTTSLALIRPIAQPTDLIAYHGEVAKLIQEALKTDVDYGLIPGTGDKPALFKPGAERINLAFGAVPEFEIVEKEIDHGCEVRWTKKKKRWNNRYQGDRSFEWDTEEGVSLGLYRYVIQCRLIRDGRLVGNGVGSCSTLESKYIDRPRDCENIVLKMAKKRAYVDATLTAYGLSNRFTQDVEDLDESVRAEVVPPARKAAEPRPATNGTAGARTDRTASVYDDNDPGMQKTLVGVLKAQKIDETLWEAIGKKLHGRPSTDLKTVIPEVLREASH